MSGADADDEGEVSADPRGAYLYADRAGDVVGAGGFFREEDPQPSVEEEKQQGDEKPEQTGDLNSTPSPRPHRPPP